MQTGLSEDFLLNIATIAITLIGFSGVVTALEHRGSERWTSAALLQFRTLVEPSIIVFFAAFVPLVLSYGGIAGEPLWRISNAVLLVGHLLGISLFWIRGVKAEVTLSQKFITVLCLPIFLFLLASALGLTSQHAPAMAIGLLLGIGVSVHNFYLLLFRD